MGQKVTPVGFRLGVTYKPQSQWFVDPRSGVMKKIYPPLILEDKFIRDFITQKFPRTAIAQILISRTLDYIRIEIHTAQAKKLSSQSTAFGSKSSAASMNRSTTNNNVTSDQNQESETTKTSSSMESSNQDIKGTSRSSDLKTLQQDLQHALAKYKKTLKSFSDWKQKTYQVGSKGSSSDGEQSTGLGPNSEEQELPRLWSYDNGQESKTSAQNAGADINLTDDSDPAEITFLEQTEKVTQHIGIIVKQLNQPFQYASIFAKYLVSQLERRENSVKQALNRSLKLIQNYNIQGIKIKVSGRLNGVDMAEQEIISKGRIPLSTIDANIDYSQDIAQTLYGTLGVKVFIFR